ncbi:hypothetical protein KN63_08120 [Smithella sp. F21]|nr:hypothetical protein KN63_08120 [Smithella sp. F21]
MAYTEPVLYSLFLGFCLSFLWGIAAWLKWQHMKSGTILPTGSFTEHHGGTVGYIINAFCIGISLSFISYLGWWLILSVAIFLFIGGWIATLIERKFYCNQFQLDTIVYAAKEYSRLSNTEGAAEILAVVAPKWWIKLMPSDWQQELREKLKEILLHENHENGK